MINSIILRCILAVFCTLSFCSAAKGGVTLDGLQCEYLTNPLGIDVTSPRFTWELQDSSHPRGQKQTGYHLLVASSPALLAANRGDIWDTGEIASSQSALVSFAGSKLVSGEIPCQHCDFRANGGTEQDH